MVAPQEFKKIFSNDALTDYLVDAGQRMVLFWDAMRQRGNQYREHMAETVPHVLQFDFELIMDGRTLPQPVNYGLVKINPPKGTFIDEYKRPFVVIDPRAGHGPGIGGFKAQSQIGMALKAGHPCYYIGFSPMPEPGQTIEAIMHAEARFIEKVRELHPKAEGKPVVVGNCQAGWAVMLLAATHPELCGPIIVAGAPLSYWAGVRGRDAPLSVFLYVEPFEVRKEIVVRPRDLQQWIDTRRSNCSEHEVLKFIVETLCNRWGRRRET